MAPVKDEKPNLTVLSLLEIFSPLFLQYFRGNEDFDRFRV
jgi:hypothetical protein